MNYLNVILKHHFRNKSARMPEGLLYLGKLGRILYRPISEIIAFLSLFLFLILIHWLFEENILNEDVKIENLNILGIIFSLMVYDSYTKNFYSNMNFCFLKIFPFSFNQKIYIYFLYEFINVKLTIPVFYIICSLIFSNNPLYDIWLGINCFIFYSVISIIISLFQIKFKFENSTSVNYLFTTSYLGTGLICILFSSFLLIYLLIGSFLLIVFSIILFKNIYDKVDFLYKQN
jgi:hypothetical protein